MLATYRVYLKHRSLEELQRIKRHLETGRVLQRRFYYNDFTATCPICAHLAGVPNAQGLLDLEMLKRELGYTAFWAFIYAFDRSDPGESLPILRGYVDAELYTRSIREAPQDTDTGATVTGAREVSESGSSDTVGVPGR